MSETQTSTQIEETKVKRNYGPATPPKVKVSDVLKMLEEGKDRKDIAAHYGLNANQTKDLFGHPKLKGKKTKKDYSSAYVLEDDTDDSVPVYVAPTPKAKTEGVASAASAESNGSTATSVPTSQAVGAEEKGAWD